MTEQKHVLSLGIGVQSSTAALLAAAKVLTPMPVCGVFADTREEPNSVYKYRDILAPIIPFPIHTVSVGRLSEMASRVRVSKATGMTYVKHQIPVFMLRSSGKFGMMGRACTLDTKIEPIRKFMRDEIVGREAYLAWRKKHKEALKVLAQSKIEKLPCPHSAWQEMQDDALVCLWIGISTDEADRAKDSVVPWIVNRHPLLEINMSRSQCLEWVAKAGLPLPPKSSCAFCPYHSDDEWIRLRQEEPEAFNAAIEFEKVYTKSIAQCPRLDGVPFLHSSRKPLDQVVFVPGKSNKSHQAPCEGMCGV
jgi:hypothetical protein